ncbi:hypothetical protein NP233_g459 [Leucocoprinus birnbaumii]|uniref:INO80 complex subunit B-like conserved region domain-containing protein n=1 Tax=Leucocoprinus birnbaumii TaxID=56174 RepID=A0AAD5Z084_9AGAR|nr:hypothetical protein NP233_g459 [Leucocoprinus birnbaumii]
MPPRTRRFSARLADLRQESDVDMDQDDEIDVENDDEEPEVDDADGEGDEDDDEDEDEDKDEMQSDEEDEDEEPMPSPRKSQPRLRIRLKLGNGRRIGSSDDSTARPTPEVEATPSRARRSRKVKSVITEDIESEDSMSPESEEDDGSASGSRPSGRAKPMTTRQAVLASMVDSSHVALGEGRPSKKKVLNETELALRREETARKRKNLTEKKLEDEKAETINRLLKKQTRPRNKRGTAPDDRSPMPGAGRKIKSKVKDDEGEAVEENEEEEVMEVVEEEIKPVMYRWTSSTKKVDGESPNMVLSFSVPQSIALVPPESEEPKPRGPEICAVEGCSQLRKYRLVKDWTIGACGMPHLKLLEG